MRTMTTKQLLATKYILENNGKVGPAMIKAGYSPAMAKNPKLFKQGKAYQELILPKLKAAGVTVDRYIDNIGKAMQADKQITVDGEIITTNQPDISTRLLGNKQAEKLLKVDQLVGTNDQSNDLEPEDLKALLSASDEVEMTRILFKKK